MSKNVAVFVDVANIFYAAKAAGVDIDYVTLLKAATANRDFVRAYAYTGLDPENENQRQFHAFLARSGYKVISKDIRKYGDGRIKANLDIELVVDMMKTARNLDIAVVVSGDGDFAPAIRAVQEMGVRCEVISFRGNTSSDLIEVADQFTDIAQIARVEKGSARSGRRVAAEGDLSMTEVPEKETEGAPRRRRGSRTRDSQAAAEVAEAAEPSNIIVLPGERLSRAPDEGDEGEEAVSGDTADGHEPGAEDGRRRRRRRGGRGRGRGRRPEDGLPVEEGAAASGLEDDEEFEDSPPAQLPHHTFGSVWDSQLGVTSTTLPGSSMTASLSGTEDDEDLDEPEVPEYLLAERRQRGGQRGPARGRGAPRGRSAYQAALDRERYGRGSSPQPSYGTSRQDRGGNRDRGGRPQGGRPTSRPPRSDERTMAPEPRTSSEPWSEVPPELEEMLRAELARKQPGTPMAPTAVPAATSANEMVVGEGGFEEVAVTDFGTTAPSEHATTETKPARKPRTSKSAAATTAEAAEPTEATDATEGTEVAEAAAPAKRTTRSRTTTAKSTTTKAKSTTTKAKSTTTKATSTKAAAEKPAAEEPAAKPTRRRSTKTTPES